MLGCQHGATSCEAFSWFGFSERRVAVLSCHSNSCCSHYASLNTGEDLEECVPCSCHKLKQGGLALAFTQTSFMRAASPVRVACSRRVSLESRKLTWEATPSDRALTTVPRASRLLLIEALSLRPSLQLITCAGTCAHMLG